MKNLQQVVEMENRIRAIFKEAPIDIKNINGDTANELFLRLDSNLSPEHLTADGERPASESRRLKKLYLGAIDELKKMGFAPQGEIYNF